MCENNAMEYLAEIERLKRIIERDNKLLQVYERWLRDERSTEKLISFLIDNGYLHVAIYGYGTLGKVLNQVLKRKKIEVDYIVETNEKKWEEGYKFIKPTDEFSCTDVVIISAINDYEDIYSNLVNKISCPIFSLEDLIP